MTPLTGFLAGVLLMLVSDGLLCLLAPRLLSNLHWQRARHTDDQMRVRGWWFLIAGVGGLLALGFL